MGRIRKLFGLAGSGKTQYMAEELVDRNVIDGIVLDRMLSISYTREARDSFKRRCASIFETKEYGGRRKTFARANVMTLHSYCFHHFIKPRYGKNFTSDIFYNIDDYIGYSEKQERIARWLQRLRMFSFDPDQMQVEIFKAVREVSEIESIYQDYMKKKGKKFDYIDILLEALWSEPEKFEWRFVTVDEAQDFTPLHWEIVKKHILPWSDDTILAGDPTQAIMLWMGADPEYFLTRIEGSEEPIELKDSWRIPFNNLPVINALQREMMDGTDAFQITSKRDGGRFDYLQWPEVVEILKDMSNNHEPALCLSLNKYKLGRIGEDLIDAGVLFAQSVNHPFQATSPTVTLSDHFAYCLYYFIVNKMYDSLIHDSIIPKMVQSSPSLFELWRKHTGQEEIKESDNQVTTVEDIMRHLHIKKDISEQELLVTLFEWPPRRHLVRAGLIEGTEEQKEMHTIKAHLRIMRYMENCGQGPYIEPKIMLSTVHAAKGSESPTVIVILDTDRLRGGDERRRLYVNAMTRSSDRIILTWLEENTNRILDGHMLMPNALAGPMTQDEWNVFSDTVARERNYADG